MSTVRDPDALLVAWLEAGPTALPEPTRQAIVERIRQQRQRRPRFSGTRIPALTRFQAFGLTAVGLALGILALVTVAGGLKREPSVPPVTTTAPSVLASPTPAPSATGETSKRFTSNLYGYSVSYPAEWTAVAATRPWPGTEPFSGSESADVLSTDRVLGHPFRGVWFSVRAIAVAVGTRAADWAAAEIPNRPEVLPSSGASALCHFASPDPRGGGPAFPGAVTEWQATTIDGEPAVIRAACGFVDAAVVVDGRAYLLSMFAMGDNNKRDRFESMAMTIRFERANSFTSPLYGYSLTYPAGWVVQPAIEQWSGRWQWEPASADVLLDPDSGLGRKTALSVRALAIHAGTSGADWAEANAARTCDGTGFYLFEPPRSEWADGTVGGEPALVRTACGMVDAVVVVGERLYLFSMFTKTDGGANTAPFREIADTVVFASD